MAPANSDTEQLLEQAAKATQRPGCCCSERRQLR
jgi:hypothetical protein